jgi:ribosomal protein L7/L12
VAEQVTGIFFSRFLLSLLVQICRVVTLASFKRAVVPNYPRCVLEEAATEEQQQQQQKVMIIELEHGGATAAAADVRAGTDAALVDAAMCVDSSQVVLEEDTAAQEQPLQRQDEEMAIIEQERDTVVYA